MQEMWELSPMERRYSVPPTGAPNIEAQGAGRGSTSEDLHAWSIYRQNLNSDFTDSALGSSEKSPLPYGNFQLRESTVHSIINHPRYGPKSELGSNMYTYLKFGLPRVLPPSRAPREGSSGYDSSDDGSPALGNRNFKRARSDPDFRNQVIHRQEVAGSVAWRERERRLKSSSEANLLTHDSYYRDRERTASRSASRVAQHDTYSDVGLVYQGRRPGSKAGSQLSMASRHSRSSRATGLGMIGGGGGGGVINGSYARGSRLLPDKLVAKDGLLTPLPGEVEAVAFKHPHLQVRNLTYEITGGKVPRRLLDGISLEVRGGEILAVMATSDEEGTALLEVLSNHHSRWGTRLMGDIVLNGMSVTPSKLGDRLAFVQRDHDFHTDLSVRQTMLFHALLQEPGASPRARDTKARISALIEDLGLGQVKHTRISDLTLSERQRLSVACHLLLDTEIVLLDEPTRGMDIFDTFFLVEYLRQWAARGRAVLVTIHPPTYEIFTMVSKVALVSTGRLMYYGRRREMLPYFAFIEYPCPAYKNPSDYYLDLVTLDTLSAEAMLESSQRIEQLAETFRRRQEPLSETGPPSPLPPRVKRSGALGQVLALWIRAMIYAFPFNVIRWVQMVLLAGSLSVAIGATFWGIRGLENPQQQNVSDRFGFYYSLLAVAPWPLLMAALHRERKVRPALVHDLRHRLYSRLWYFLAQFTYSFPTTGGIFLAYVVPAYAMAGLQSDEKEVMNFYTFIGYTLLYMYAIHALVIAMSHLLPWPHLAALLAGLVFLCAALASGYSVHVRDLGFWCAWVRFASPMHWVLHPLSRAEFRNVPYFACPRNPVVKQDNTILVQVECGIKDGTAALSFVELGDEASVLNRRPFLPAVATLAFGLVFLVLGLMAFLVFRGRRKKA